MADTKEKKTPPAPKVRELLSSFESGALQNGSPKSPTERPVARPGGARKLAEVYEKKSEKPKPPEIQRKAPKAAAAPAAVAAAEEPQPAPAAPPPPKYKVLAVRADTDALSQRLLDALQETLGAQGHEVQVSDLPVMGFNPFAAADGTVDEPKDDDLNDTSEDSTTESEEKTTGTFEVSGSYDVSGSYELDEQAKVTDADLVVFVASLRPSGVWPALLHAYFEACLTPPSDTKRDAFFENGYLKGKRCLLGVVLPGCPAAFSARSMLGDLEVLLWPVQNNVLAYSGFDVLAPELCVNDAEASDAALDAWRARLAGVFDEQPLKFVPLERFDPEDHWQMSSTGECSQGVSPGQHFGKGFPAGCMSGVVPVEGEEEEEEPATEEPKPETADEKVNDVQE